MSDIVIFESSEITQKLERIALLEECLKEYEDIQKEARKLKEQLYSAMKTHDVKSWVTPNGTTITRVDEKLPETKVEHIIDLERFAEEAPEEYNELMLIYGKDVQKYTNGRKGYVKITAAKERTV